MNHLTQKIKQLKWLKAIGVEYCCSESTRAITIEKKVDIKEKILLMKLNSQTQSDIYSNDPLNERVKQGSEGEKIVDKYAWSQANSMKCKDSNLKELSSMLHNKQKPSQSISTQDNNYSNIMLARSLADSANNIDQLKELVLTFEGCSLKQLANNTVFSDGDPQSSLMFIGEAPGKNEDETGIPFCGESGKLLDNMLFSINISRKHNAYITNTIFWRPPANRQPTQEEIEICRPFVEKHISLINPKLIILVGNVAATSLLGKNAGISKIRQEYYLYTNKYLTKPINTTSIFHPAYLLRQPMQKKTTWYDLIKIQQFIKNI